MSNLHIDAFTWQIDQHFSHSNSLNQNINHWDKILCFIESCAFKPEFKSSQEKWKSEILSLSTFREMLKKNWNFGPFTNDIIAGEKAFRLRVPGYRIGDGESVLCSAFFVAFSYCFTQCIFWCLWCSMVKFLG